MSFQGGEEEFSEVVLDERSKKAESWHRDAAIRAQYTKPAQPITCATFAQDVLEGRAKVSQAHEHKHQSMIFGPASLVGGGLTSERERMAAQVFQPMHRYFCLSDNIECFLRDLLFDFFFWSGVMNKRKVVLLITARMP